MAGHGRAIVVLVTLSQSDTVASVPVAASHQTNDMSLMSGRPSAVALPELFDTVRP